MKQLNSICLQLILLLSLMGCMHPNQSTSSSAAAADPETHTMVTEVNNSQDNPNTTDAALPAESTSEEPETQAENDLYFTQLLEAHRDDLIAYELLPSGSLLLARANQMGNQLIGSWVSPDEIVLSYMMVDKTGSGEYLISEYLEPTCSSNPISIFYDKDLGMPGAEENTDYSYTTDYLSNFFWHEGIHGREAVILIYPNYRYQRDLQTGGKKIGRYEDSAFYPAVPQDTLGTTPLLIQNENWHNGYPCWVFALKEETITEEYELHYLDYVLTGKDLLSSEWSSGGRKYSFTPRKL